MVCCRWDIRQLIVARVRYSNGGLSRSHSKSVVESMKTVVRAAPTPLVSYSIRLAGRFELAHLDGISDSACDQSAVTITICDRFGLLLASKCHGRREYGLCDVPLWIR